MLQKIRYFTFVVGFAISSYGMILFAEDAAEQQQPVDEQSEQSEAVNAEQQSDDDASDPDKADQKEPADDDKTGPKNINAYVPERLKDKGYVITINQQKYELEQGNVDIQSDGGTTTEVHLYQRSNRLVDFRRTVFDEDLVDDMKDRMWRLGLLLGASSGKKSAWKDAMLTGNRFQLGAELGFQPSRWGAALFWFQEVERNQFDGSLRAVFLSNSTGLSAVYEFRPARSYDRWYSNLHYAILAGAFFSQYRFAIEDDYLSEQDDGKSVGSLIGFDFRLPLAANFWLYLRLNTTKQTIKLEKFKIKDNGPNMHFNIGCFYDF